MILDGSQNVNDLHLIGATFTRRLDDGSLFVLPDGLDLSPLANSATMQALREASADANNADLIQSDKLARLLFEINYDQENRLRTLAGQPTITRAQYRNGLLTVWRSL